MGTKKDSGRPRGLCWLVLAGLLVLLRAEAQIPQVLNHQGRVLVDGAPYEGPGAFRFALVNANTGTNTWTNDGTQVGTGGTPVSAVTVNVVEGVYSVGLGDTSLSNMGALSGAAFSTDRLRLRIWFDDGIHGIQRLAPDQVVTSAAFAFKSESAATADLLGSSTESSLDESAEIDADINTHDTNPNAHATIQLSATRITSGKIDNARLNTGHGNGLDADTVDGAQAAALEESAEIDADIAAHNTYVNAHATIQLSAARITSGKIDNARLNTGPGNGLDADTVDGAQAAALEESAEIDADIAAHNAYVNAHATIQLSAARITSGKIDNGRLNMGAGNGLDADMVDGQHASAFMAASTDDWVDETGDSVVGSESYRAGAPEASALLSARNTGSGHGLYGEAEGGDGAVGVYGAASSQANVSNYGGYFEADGENGRGVQAKAGNSSGLSNYGGYFEAAASAGRGVYGAATGTNGRGVEGLSEGSNGIGVFGKASNTGAGNVIGGYFESSGSVGRGVQGYASNTANAVNYGGYFEAKGGQGRGIYSKASGSVARGEADGAKASTNYGGYFEADGETGQAVYGEATDATGENFGGFFMAMGVAGQGVHGEATDTTGLNYGGYFAAAGMSGHGLHAVATGEIGTGLYAEATSDGPGEKYGGHFTAAGSNGTGVYADGGGFDFYSAGGGGGEYGPFTGSHEVKLSADFPRDFEPGMIVSVTGETQTRIIDGGGVGLSSTLPTVRLADTSHDQAVFGVIVVETVLRENHWYAAEPGERFAIVHALGEGRVWVCDCNGPIEVGDYITTSRIPGYGQRQDDDLMHAYTLGKATEAVHWDPVANTAPFGNQAVKVALVAVVYCSG